MENVENDIQRAIRIMKGDKKYEFQKYSPTYMFATENIGGYLPSLGVKEKDILTVCSSGDHLLNGLVAGANSIDTFDINQLSYYMAWLKIAAVKGLSLEDFYRFFRVDKKEPKALLEEGIYRDIASLLPEDVKAFWDELEKARNEKNSSFINLFRDGYMGGEKEAAKSYNAYSKAKQYLLLQKRLLTFGFDFLNADMRELSTSITKKYDVIFLSNIWDYIVSSDLEDFIAFLEQMKSSLLNPEGRIITYHFAGYFELYNLELKNLAKEYPSFEEKTVKGLTTKDKILIYQ